MLPAVPFHLVGATVVSSRRLPVLFLLAATALAGGLWPLAGSAQVIRGTVIDAATGDVVVAAYVAILDTGGVAVGGGATGADGRFSLRAPGQGAYRFRASRLGYDGALSELVDVRSGADVSLLLRMKPSPVDIPSITVEANARVARLESVGFYQRRAMGFGHFLTEEQIEAKVPIRTTDLLRNMPGVRVLIDRWTGEEYDVMMRGAEAMFIRGGCMPSIVVDGYVVRAGGITPRGMGTPPSLNGTVRATEIEALEVYNGPAGVPVGASGSVSPCGAVVVWRKR